MRQLGTLPDAAEAHRFASFLITLGVHAHAEQDGDDGWAIWVRDENDMDVARAEFQHFQADPHDERYQGVVEEADSILRQKAKQREQAQRNIVEMRSHWKGAALGRKPPFVITLIILSVLVSLATNFGATRPNTFGATARAALGFCDIMDFQLARADPLVNIRQGQLWRLITPIFLHFGPIHLVFNMFMFYQFGKQIEHLRGSGKLALFVLLIAVLSNVAQAVFPAQIGRLEIPDQLSGNPFFGGMSGVVYGLFGYIWMKSRFEPDAGFFMSPSTVFILVIWLFLCMTPAMNVANVAHVAGLLVGVALGYAPVLFHPT